MLLVAVTLIACPDDPSNGSPDTTTAPDATADAGASDVAPTDTGSDGNPSNTDSTSGDALPADTSNDADGGGAVDTIAPNDSSVSDSSDAASTNDLEDTGSQDTAMGDLTEPGDLSAGDSTAVDVADGTPQNDTGADAGPSPDVDTGDVGPSCGAITFQGCCDGTVLKFCELGVLVETDCAPSTCGWFPDFGEGIYACDEVGEDPSGNAPIACPSP